MWQVKLIAAAGVLLCGIAEGARCSRYLTLRRQALQELVLLFDLLQVRIENGGGLTEEDILSVCEECRFCVLRTPERKTVPRPEAADQADIPEMLDGLHVLSEQDKACAAVALQAGFTRQQAAAKLSDCAEQLRKSYEKAAETEKKNRKLYLQMGGLIAVLIIVVLM